MGFLSEINSGKPLAVPAHKGDASPESDSAYSLMQSMGRSTRFYDAICTSFSCLPLDHHAGIDCFGIKNQICPSSAAASCVWQWVDAADQLRSASFARATVISPIAPSPKTAAVSPKRSWLSEGPGRRTGQDPSIRLPATACLQASKEHLPRRGCESPAESRNRLPDLRFGLLSPGNQLQLLRQRTCFRAQRGMGSQWKQPFETAAILDRISFPERNLFPGTCSVLFRVLGAVQSPNPHLVWLKLYIIGISPEFGKPRCCCNQFTRHSLPPPLLQLISQGDQVIGTNAQLLSAVGRKSLHRCSAFESHLMQLGKDRSEVNMP